MIKKVIEPLAAGFRDALRLFVAILVAPFGAVKAFLTQTARPAEPHIRGHK
jgi:hypothetical protein